MTPHEFLQDQVRSGELKGEELSLYYTKTIEKLLRNYGEIVRHTFYDYRPGDLINFVYTHYTEINMVYGGISKDLIEGALAFYFQMNSDEESWNNFIKDVLENKSKKYFLGVQYGIVWSQHADVGEIIQQKFAPFYKKASKRIG